MYNDNIPEEERKYSFPEPATPTPDAKIIDLRFAEFEITLSERVKHDKPTKNGEAYYTGDAYCKFQILGNEKIKGKVNKKAFILFAIPI